jgi:hypothetical protein
LAAGTAADAIADVAYVPPGDHVVIASADGFVLVLDTQQYRVTARIDVGGPITAADAGRDALIVVAGADDHLHGYGVDGRRRLHVPTTGTLTRVRFSSNGEGLLTAGSSGTAGIWVTDRS